MALLQGKARVPCLLWAPRLGLLRAPHRAEALLELVDSSLGVDELLLAREERVGVGGDSNGNDKMINSVHLLDSIGLRGRARHILLAGTHVLENDRTVFGVEIRFHENGALSGGRGECAISCRCQEIEPVTDCFVSVSERGGVALPLTP